MTAPATIHTSIEVVLIEDEPLVASSMKSTLSRVAHVTYFEGINDALDHLRVASVDVILCDLGLRGHSGQELHTWLAAHRPGLLTHLAYVTGGACTSESQAFLDDIQPPCLLKPFTRQELVSFVDDVVRR